MPSIIINEIDETSAGTTSIVNDVAYVPGFSNKASTVTKTSSGKTNTYDIKYVKDSDPTDFVPYLRFINGTPPNGSTITVTGSRNGTDQTVTFTGNGTQTVFEFTKTDYLDTVQKVVVGNVIYNLFVAGEEPPTTAENVVVFGSVGDYFINSVSGSLFEGRNAIPDGEQVILTGTATLTVTTAGVTQQMTLGEDVSAVTSCTATNLSTYTYDSSSNVLTLTFSESQSTGNITLSVTCVLTGDGKKEQFSTGMATISDEGGAIYGTTNITNYTNLSTGTVSFIYVFWNYVDYQNDPNYSVVIVPENTPTYCSTKAQFEALFGEFPYKFEEIQLYGANMFTANATPSGSVMFRVGDPDPSYVYAKELICSGMPVYYDNVVNRLPDGSRGAVTVQHMYDYLLNGTTVDGKEGPYYKLQDPNEYNVKYVTSGGYPLFEYTAGIAPTDNPSPSTPVPKPYEPAMNMMNVASTGLLGDTKNSDDFLGRGDIIALIDHTNNPSRSFTGDDSVWESLTGSSGAMEFWSDETLHCDPSYGVMFTPWFKYTTKFTQDYVVKNDKKVATGSFVIKMPASFAYLIGLANSIKNFPAWMAIAGVNRGQVQNYTGRTTAQVLTNKIAQQFQFRQDKSSINPITEVRPYGQCVYGNRTLKEHENGLTATAFLNIRNLVCDVKKTVYRAAKRCLFEQDTDVLWINFKSMITPTLDQMVTGQGISAYKILRVPTNVKAKMEAKVILYPIYAIEDIEVTVVMRDEEVSVTSNQ